MSVGRCIYTWIAIRDALNARARAQDLHAQAVFHHLMAMESRAVYTAFSTAWKTDKTAPEVDILARTLQALDEGVHTKLAIYHLGQLDRQALEQEIAAWWARAS